MSRIDPVVRGQSDVRVRACARNQFDEADFRNSLDQFKDVLVLPASTLASLFGPDRTTGYVTMSTPGGDEAVRAYALSFAPAHEHSSDGLPRAYLRDTLREQLKTDAFEPELDIKPLDIPDVGPLDVVRLSTATESTEPNACRLHPETLSQLNCADGDTVELYNPEHGYRFSATVRSEPALAPDQISLSTRARKLLQVEYPERAAAAETTVLRARESVACQEPTWSLLDPLRAAGRWLLDVAVNYNETQLRIVIGLNADEGRGTGRVNEDTMDILAIDDGDRARIRSKETETSVLLRPIAPDSHLIDTDEDITASNVRDRTILLPSTVRQELDAICGDTVSVRRDTRHIAIHQLTVSVFAFLGALIGGLQTVDLFVPAQYQLHGFGLTLIFCLGAVWLLLWPERERCR